MKSSSDNDDLKINEKDKTTDRKLIEKELITLDPNDQVLNQEGEIPSTFASFFKCAGFCKFIFR
jgi:hypothetical protein